MRLPKLLPHIAIGFWPQQILSISLKSRKTTHKQTFTGTSSPSSNDVMCEGRVFEARCLWVITSYIRSTQVGRAIAYIYKGHIRPDIASGYHVLVKI